MATLLKGDCLEVMRTLPDKSVDCFICDLPYGQMRRSSIGALAEKKKCFGRTPTGCDWDIPIDLEAFWVQVKRLARNDLTPVLMFCTTKFGYELIKSNEAWFRYDIVWEKTNGVGFLAANKMPLRAHEMIYVFSKKGSYYKRVDIPADMPPRCVRSVVRVSNKKPRGGHPTSKPVELYTWLLERYCPAGGTVLDPTAGSFNFARAALALGLKPIGIEKDEAFFKAAADTITHV